MGSVRSTIAVCWPPDARAMLGALLLTSLACGREEPAPIETPAVPTAESTGDAAGARAALVAGQEAAALGDLDQALVSYRKAVELDPASAAAHFALGSALVPSAWLAVDAAAEDPAASERKVKLGMDHTVVGEGIEHLRRATEIEPEDAEYAYWLGRALHVADRDEDAVVALRRALELDPSTGPARKRLGLIYLDQGESELAREHLTAALELLPEDAGVPFQLGNLCLEEDPRTARGHFERALAIDPTLPWAHHNLSLALARLGDEAGAAREREAYETWKRFDAELSARVERAEKRASDAAAQIEAGEHLFAAGRNEQALGFFRRALRLDPEDALAHLYCGVVLLRSGEPGAARAHLERSVELAPDAVEPKVELARACVALGDEARVQALEADLADLVRPDDPDAELLFAQWLLERGRAGAAVPHFEAVLAAVPESREARDGLERARREEAR
jgi:tetratricopeptide (TPR) repeat protein